MNPDLIQSFIGKQIQIKVEDTIVCGRLCAFYISELNSTCILLLQCENGLALMKDFESLGAIER
jgi:hypothetical protein